MTRSRVLGWSAVAALAVTLFLIFFYAPTEAVQGEVQKIFYVHVPAAWVAYLAFIVVGAASILVLARNRDWRRWDAIAAASAETGVVFATVCLATGIIWAKRAWGVWWAWDVRLTSTLVLWLIYLGYLAFRATSPPGDRRARLSAVIAIVGLVDIPVVHFAVTWWTSAHPDPTVLRPGGPELPGEMLLTLLVAFVAFTLLYVAFVATRIRIERSRSDIGPAPEPARV